MSQSSHNTTDFHLEVLESTDALRAIAHDWDDLWRRSNVTMPTLRAEPATLWIDTFTPEARLHILTVRQGNQLVAALPIVARRLRHIVPVGDVPLNQWSANGDLLIDAETDIVPLRRFWPKPCATCRGHFSGFRWSPGNRTRGRVSQRSSPNAAPKSIPARVRGRTHFAARTLRRLSRRTPQKPPTQSAKRLETNRIRRWRRTATAR